MSSLEERGAAALFEVIERHGADRVELHLTGELDLASVAEFEAAFDRVSREARMIVVDMSGMEIAATMHLSEVPAPTGVTFLDDPDETIIATIVVPTEIEEPEEIEEETELVGEEVPEGEEAPAEEGEAPPEGEAAGEGEES